MMFESLKVFVLQILVWSSMFAKQQEKESKKGVGQRHGKGKETSQAKGKEKGTQKDKGKEKGDKGKELGKGKGKEKGKRKEIKASGDEGGADPLAGRGCLRELEFAAGWRCYRSSLFAAGKGADPWATPVAMRHKERLQQEKKAEEELHGCDIILLLLVVNFSTSHLFGKRDATV